MSGEFVQVVVGGFPYSIAVSDIEKFPGCFFECMIKKEWLNDREKPITIERDGALFKYVNAYLVCDTLPRNKEGQIALDDESLEALKAEADFFGLDALSKECKVVRKKVEHPDLNSYMTIRKYLAQGWRVYKKNPLEIEYRSPLISALKTVWAPFCLSGNFKSMVTYYCRENFYKNSSICDIKVDELIAEASQSPFGRGTETVTDTAVRSSLEIDASLFNKVALTKIVEQVKIKDFAPNLKVEVRPYKLVIYQEGGHFHEHRDTVRGDGHIGTLVVILNSEYTGGELEVTHGGRTESVTGAYSWVAMYGDCVHKINPVTSGTRVSLIFDLYGTPREFTSEADEDDDMDEENDEEEDEYDEYDDDDEDEGAEDRVTRKFWEDQEEQYYEIPPQDRLRGVDEAQKTEILECLGNELQTVSSVIITLQHLYPECQTSPAFLKGGDRALYELLSEQYDVQVVAATIYRIRDPEYDEVNDTQAALFSPAIVKRTLGLRGSDSDSEDAGEESAKLRSESEGRTKLVIPNHLARDSVLDYTPYVEHTGNESQAEETVYIVAGLQVRKAI